MKRLTQSDEHAQRLVRSGEHVDTNKARSLCQDYLDRSGLTLKDFAHRINYSDVTLRMFLSSRYHHIAGTGRLIARAIQQYIAEHPIEPLQRVYGELYETENARTIRATFQKLLPRPVAYAMYGPPGFQKSFVLEYEVARLNRDEMPKNGAGRRAFYVYAEDQVKPTQLMKEIAIACGTSSLGDKSRIARNLGFDFRNRRVLLVIDEAQHLDLHCFEAVRRLLDRPPHFSLLFAGSHGLLKTFNRFSAVLAQLNSRIIATVRLPGLTEKEAETIAWNEVGEWLRLKGEAKARAKVRDLIEKSMMPDAFDNGKRYINVRVLTNSLDQLKAATGVQQ